MPSIAKILKHLRVNSGYVFENTKKITLSNVWGNIRIKSNGEENKKQKYQKIGNAETSNEWKI